MENTIKVKVKAHELVEREVEIALPHFCTGNGIHWYKVESETKVTKVYVTDDCASIESGRNLLGSAMLDRENPCTEAEFQAAFDSAMAFLQTKR